MTDEGRIKVKEGWEERETGKEGGKGWRNREKMHYILNIIHYLVKACLKKTILHSPVKNHTVWAEEQFIYWRSKKK